MEHDALGLVIVFEHDHPQLVESDLVVRVDQHWIDEEEGLLQKGVSHDHGLLVFILWFKITLTNMVQMSSHGLPIFQLNLGWHWASQFKDHALQPCFRFPKISHEHVIVCFDDPLFSMLIMCLLLMPLLILNAFKYPRLYLFGLSASEVVFSSATLLERLQLLCEALSYTSVKSATVLFSWFPLPFSLSPPWKLVRLFQLVHLMQSDREIRWRVQCHCLSETVGIRDL